MYKWAMASIAHSDVRSRRAEATVSLSLALAVLARKQRGMAAAIRAGWSRKGKRFLGVVWLYHWWFL